MSNSPQQQHNGQKNPDGILDLFAKQEKVYPKRVWGRYRQIKWAVMILTLGIYYIAPFLRWDRGPNAPDQAILIDLPARRAYWFNIEIWPQEIYILTGILILAAIALFFVTSMLGRVWCGYLCPQTVWTDLFIWVERIVQGDRNARKKLHNAPWGFSKIRKICVTYFLWLVIGFLTSGAFVLYFTDAPTLIINLLKLDVSFTITAFMGGITFSTYLMAGFAREQVCIYMCPYARFQSAMFDKDTLIIGYDVQRGEKRDKKPKDGNWEGRGHCIDCTACVQVCPTGIDIRDGLQMECIACGLCVDACNDIMDKIDLPRGLIRYDTADNIETSTDSRKEFKFLRPRTYYYSIIMAAVGMATLYPLINRTMIELHVLHDRNPVFVQLSSGDIRNGYTFKILNKTHQHKTYSLSVEGIENATLDVKAAGDINENNLYVSANSVGTYHINLKADIPPAATRGITFILKDNDDGSIDKSKSIFVSRNGK